LPNNKNGITAEFTEMWLKFGAENSRRVWDGISLECAMN